MGHKKDFCFYIEIERHCRVWLGSEGTWFAMLKWHDLGAQAEMSMCWITSVIGWDLELEKEKRKWRITPNVILALNTIKKTKAATIYKKRGPRQRGDWVIEESVNLEIF
jgi:hypothetical protein